MNKLSVGYTSLGSLAPHHREVLEKSSGISPKIISERGYLTATRPEELQALGFADYQTEVPALVIPVRGVEGEVLFHRSRPDSPRHDPSKPSRVIKYEQPTRTGIALDIPPSARTTLLDPNTRLWVVEGEKKADALVSRGECAVALLGVWSWKRDGLPLPEWDSIPLIGREVLVCFDSDSEHKVEVQRALAGLVAYLAARGAHG